MKYAIIATATAAVTVLIIFVVLRSSPERQVESLPVRASAQPPKRNENKDAADAASHQQKTKKSLEFRPDETNACMKAAPGKHYSNYSQLPGGPNEKRPWVVISTGDWNGGVGVLGNETFFLFELTLVDRGEASIVKDWRICLVQEGMPVMYRASEIPPAGFPVQIGDAVKTIPVSDSLPEKTISTPVAYGNTAVGWILFKIPGTVIHDEFVQKHKRQFAIQFKDYLDHEYTFDGAWNDSEPTQLLYVWTCPHC